MPVSLSSMADFNLQYYAAPSECLFALSNHKLIDYSIGVTGVGSDRLTSTYLFISAEMRDKLYEGRILPRMPVMLTLGTRVFLMRMVIIIMLA